MKVSKKQVLDTAQLSTREAAKVLGVGKSSVQRARNKYANEGKPKTDNGLTDPMTLDETLAYLDSAEDETMSSASTGSSETHVTIEDDLEADGVTNGSHRLSYAYSEWDMPDGRVGRSRRVTAVPVTETVPTEEIDPDALLKRVRESSTGEVVLVSPGASTFVVSFNDWQYGKKTRQGSTEDTICIVTGAIEKAKQRIVDLQNMGYGFSELIIIFGGDLAEGCNNTPQGAFGIEMGRTDQLKGCISLALLAVDELAPMFPRATVLGVRGNHGENRVNNGKPTTPEDNDDTFIVSMVELAAQRDNRLQHVEFNIADDEAGVWVLTQSGWVLGTTHGDVYGKGVSGATTERKVNAWYKNMAAGRDPMGLVDVLITHHYHHSQSADYGSWEWHQTPAQDGAMSEYFRQASGNYSEPGVLTFVMAEERYLEPRVV